MPVNSKFSAPAFQYLALWIGAFLLFAFCFEPMVSSPNSILVTNKGDGIKNYFTYWYYIYYDSGNHFSGMNYPFGEHIIFTDNMPLLSVGIKKLAPYFPNIVRYSLGILHMAILAAHLAGVHYLFKILRHYRVAPLWAGAGALLIAYCSPQTFRMLGHFGMAFSCLLPFVIYQLIRYHQYHRLKYVVAIFIILSLSTFLHLYNFVLTAIVLLGYTFAYLVTNRKGVLFRKMAGHVLPLIITIGTVFLGLNTYIGSTDKITDRPDYPLGVFNGATEGRDIFVSDTYLGQLLAPVFGKHKELGDSEGYIYLGIIGTVVAIYFISRVLAYIFRKSIRNSTTHWHIVPEFNIWLIVAFLSLLIGMGVPFVWFKQFFADHISTLRQFRTIGRFSWIFYYLFMIYTCIVVYRWAVMYGAKGRKYMYSIGAAVVIIWGIQFLGYARHFRAVLMPGATVTYNKVTDKEGSLREVLRQNGIGRETYQAILMLPYFHVGSEKLWLYQETQEDVMAKAVTLSMLSGLPIVDVMMSRTSWSQTFAAIQLADGPFNEQKILNVFNDKPLLLAVVRPNELSYKEATWLQYAKRVATLPGDSMTLYTIDLPAYKRLSAAYRESAEKEVLLSDAQRGLLYGMQGYYYKEDFESSGNLAYGYRGRKSWNVSNSTEKSDYITAIPLPDTAASMDYIFSIWAQVNKTDYRHPVFELFFKDKKGDDLGSCLVRGWNVTMEDDFWLLYDTRFSVPPNTVRADLIVHNADIGVSYLALDELLVRSAGTVYYEKGGRGVILNNRTLSSSK